MLKRIDELLAEGEDFAFETTLASRSFANTLEHAQQQGYFITLLFFWLHDPQLAVQRVQSRVREGGHSIPTETILRRYQSGIKNLFGIYFQIPDLLLMYDNSNGLPELVMHKKKGVEELIMNSQKFSQLKSIS
jgi:predicted ABC-type ATPase